MTSSILSPARSVKRAASLTLAALLGAAPAFAQDLTVYSGMAKDHFAELMAAFEAQEPDLRVNKIIDSFGPIMARTLAEKDNPQADVILGLSVNGLIILDEQDMLLPYAPAGLEHIKERFRDDAEEPVWVGTDAWASALCYNTIEGERGGVPAPASWQDLLAPEYRSKIVMPNPSSSATGLVAIEGWIAVFGEEGAWDYMDALHENIAQYVHSGSAPCRMTASGEAVVGISYPAPGVQAMRNGAPVSVVIPEEGVGYEIEGVAILKGAKNPDAAKRLADFAASPEAHAIHAKYYGLVGHSEVESSIEGHPAGEEDALVDLDFREVATNRERILAEWDRRYGAGGGR